MRAALFVALCGSILVNATPMTIMAPPITAEAPIVGPPIVGAGTPKYLSIKDFKQCLSSQSQGSFSTWCMPAKKPEACCDQSWKELCALEGKDKVSACQKPAPPPKYTEVKDYEKCVVNHPSGKGKKCLPFSKPAACCDESWKKLKALTDELSICPAVDPIPTRPVLPPKYLGVKDWQKCTGSLKEGSASFVCLPATKPGSCCDESWKALNGLTGGDKLRSCDSAPIPPIIKPVLPPKYLGVKDWQKCTGSLKEGTASFVCLPTAKPEGCCDESWKALNGFTGGDKLKSCSASQPPVIKPVLPPKYLGVKDFNKCLQTCPSGTSTSWCLPDKKPDACCDQSWKELSGFTGSDKVPPCEK